MDSIIVTGGKPLFGKIEVSGAKNAALPIIASTVLTASPVVLRNIPKLTDINTIMELLASLGAQVTKSEDIQNNCHTLQIDCSSINNLTAHYDIVRKMRASIWVLAPLLARFGEAIVSLPGGCSIGARQVDLHINVLEAMGAKIQVEHGYIHSTVAPKLRGTEFIFTKTSVGATITGIMAGVLADGETVLSNCAVEPEIIDLCNFLNQLGAEVQNIGAKTLRIIGKKSLHGADYRVMPDRIEAGTYMVAAGITKGELDILGIEYNLVDNIASKLQEAGLLIQKLDNGVRVSYTGPVRATNIETEVYPGYSTDLQAQFMSLMTLARGQSIITENIFENRFMHVSELVRMGADIKINDHTAIIQGISSLGGAEVMASDLRASVSLVLAGLAAEGDTKVKRIYHIDRGYQDLEHKLQQCGARIRRVAGDKA